MFGCEGTPIGYSESFTSNPKIEQKNKLYNQCDIWLAPTKLEGLHIPAAEAMLTECPVVGTKTELNGMEDYLISGKTGFLSEDDFDDFVNKIEKVILLSKEERNLIGKCARETVLQIGSRKENMIKLINIFENWR
jgi:glycosyltransferase involved in cell wall biosynthesis